MITINLYDTVFKHLATIDGNYSMAGHPLSGNKPKNVRYVHNFDAWTGVTIFTDDHLDPRLIKKVKSPTKIGWLIERIYTPTPKLEECIDALDILMTNNREILDAFPKKARFIPFGGSWIREENKFVCDKSKDISMIYSSKKFQKGHQLRHGISQSLSGSIDLYGNGSPNPIKYKEEGLQDYRFSVIIENESLEGYFTEKLIDCLLVGTIPVYWGCPDVYKFFDTKGMAIFEDQTQLENLLPQLTEELYFAKMPHILENFKRAEIYQIPEDWYYEHILVKEGLV